jgi:anthranilate synthase component 1
MHYTPDFDAFERLAAGSQMAPVCRRLLSDALTPVSAFHKLDTGGSACLFESVIGGEKVGRYSFLAFEPFLELHARGNTVTISRAPKNGLGHGPGEWTHEEFESSDPLNELRTRLTAVKAARQPGLPPFTGGAVGFASYDVVRYAEKLPNAPPDDRGLPDLSFAFYDQMVVFDNVTKTMFAVAQARLDEAQGNVRKAYDDACLRVDALVEKLAGRHSSAHADLQCGDIGGSTFAAPHIDYKTNFPKPKFEAAVRKCVEYIRAGDIFQVVISQRMEIPLKSDPFELYRTLRVVNPSPFMFFLRTPECTLVGSSPEIMCRVMNGKVTVRPLAGTRRRGASEEEDARLAEELLADPKERAEHVMLVDLGRNDVGRVARYGSIHLSDVMTIERYSHVMHLSSSVTGELAEGKDAFDALIASLPAGTVSGAPKVRAMQIIDELEPNRRGPYAGAVGYIDYGGNMDTCIALRTIVIQGDEHERKAYVQCGAGIVADSDPASEHQETLNKARGLLTAIELTELRTSENSDHIGDHIGDHNDGQL